ncbi:MAG TPA: DUF488 family protein [Vicinamibacteria bacterium]|nr:DUF488 family protein [Vicinamibacteria bacterium]
MSSGKSRKQIKLKRAYEPSERRDGFRVLVDRLWPRGVRKEGASIDEHMKEVAPSAALRTWFGHDPAKWEEFRRRYGRELEGKPAPIAHLAAKAQRGNLTLVYAAKDSERNNAVVLRDYLLRLRKLRA